MEDSCGKPVAGGFYEYELHRVANPDVYLVEKILRKRRNEVCGSSQDRTEIRSASWKAAH